MREENVHNWNIASFQDKVRRTLRTSKVPKQQTNWNANIRMFPNVTVYLRLLSCFLVASLSVID